MKTVSRGLSVLADALLRLTYTDMMELAQDLADMCAEPESRKSPKTANDYASLLHDWAEAQED